MYASYVVLDTSTNTIVLWKQEILLRFLRKPLSGYLEGQKGYGRVLCTEFELMCAYREKGLQKKLTGASLLAVIDVLYLIFWVLQPQD
jgi:hypothetical protein